jgi:dolichyl-phosphate beta-glucosyltransferase
MKARGQQDALSQRQHSSGGLPPDSAGHAGPARPHFKIASRLPAERSLFGADHDLTVIVPAFNEEERLPATLQGLADYLNRWGIDYRVLVIDDGSRDATAQLAANFGSRFTTVSQPNSGKGAAVRNGMLRATGRVVAFTDADLPYDLDSLRIAYEMVTARACEVVFGARDLKESTIRAPRRIMRTAAHWIFRSIVQILISRQITDTQCGLKIFSRSAAREIFSRTTIDGFAFDAEVVYLTHRLSLPFRRVPVTLINEYSSTISLSRHALPMLLDVMALRLRALRSAYALDQAAETGAAAQPAAIRQRNAA